MRRHPRSSHAGAGQRFLDTTDDLGLLALRAMSRRPVHILARVGDDPAGAWRNGDQQTIRGLAELQLRSSGLRSPEVAAAG